LTPTINGKPAKKQYDKKKIYPLRTSHSWLFKTGGKLVTLSSIINNIFFGEIIPFDIISRVPGTVSYRIHFFAAQFSTGLD